MGRMIRKQVYIEPEQEKLLKQQAKRLGVSEAELIRRGIEQVVHVSPAPFPDEQAWQEEFSSYQQSPEYQKINVGMDLEGFKKIYWFEFAHRVPGR